MWYNIIPLLESSYEETTIFALDPWYLAAQEKSVICLFSINPIASSEGRHRKILSLLALEK
jgi:hypothetical protein